MLFTFKTARIRLVLFLPGTQDSSSLHHLADPSEKAHGSNPHVDFMNYLDQPELPVATNPGNLRR